MLVVPKEMLVFFFQSVEARYVYKLFLVICISPFFSDIVEFFAD